MNDPKNTVADGELLSAPNNSRESKNSLVATGGILGAIAASSCCLLPLVLTLLGISGAWMANLRALQPYQPVFIVITIIFLSYGFYLVYWKPNLAVAEGTACARPIVSTAVVRASLWIATAIVLVAATFNYWFPLALPYLP